MNEVNADICYNLSYFKGNSINLFKSLIRALFKATYYSFRSYERI
jgi:hypothetical protein